jgi:hypothetical protein
MKIANIVTISTYSAFYNAYEERQIWLIRRYRLTYRGAKRILRKLNTLGANSDGSIVRIETAVYA